MDFISISAPLQVKLQWHPYFNAAPLQLWDYFPEFQWVLVHEQSFSTEIIQTAHERSYEMQLARSLVAISKTNYVVHQ